MIDLEQIRAAEERYAQRDRTGESEAERQERTLKRIARVTAAEGLMTGGPTAAIIDSPPSDSADTGRVALERLLGRNDLMSILYLERGVIAARTVCRITIRRSSSSNASGFGTGSLVSPRLLLTNNHVLRSDSIARFSVAEFDFQETLASAAPQSRFFQLDPDAFFLTDPTLDFTLVAVRDPEQLLRPYGWNQLVAEEGKVREGEPVTIIQHPRAETKQIALRENEITDILENFLLYRTDTAPGSSGSPVFNDQWELVGLHHAGVPRKRNGQILTRTGEPWDDSMDEDLIDWIANEGARISRIIRHLKGATLTPEQAKLRAQCFEADVPRVAGGGGIRPAERAGGGGGQPVVRDGVATWTIPIELSVRLGDCGVGVQPAPAPPAPAPPSPAVAPEEPDSDELRQALDALREARTRPYLDSAADAKLRNAFYGEFELPEDAGDAYDALRDLVTRTHKTRPKYKPAREVYPWVDLHPNLKIRSIYSGQQFEAEELIREDFRLEAAVEAMRQAGETEESISALEAALPFNCEHVVPQSWFAKKEPMRGDLHHLFACESRCNSFRSNTPYFDFTEVEEAFRDQCGRSEKRKFEPVDGKGPVARATLYFLIRYPGLINDPGEYDEERIEILKRWHRESPPGKYEKHRNWAVNERQGNRNPFIDHPDWVDQVDFTKGLG